MVLQPLETLPTEAAKTDEPPAKKQLLSGNRIDYESMLIKDVYAIAAARKIKGYTTLPLRELVDTLHILDFKERKYFDYTIPTLKTFVADRNLVLTKKRPRKREIIAVLEQADRDWTFPLLGLPPELRQIIYTLSLLDSDMSTPLTRPHQPNMTQVSSLVRSEALPIFYAINTFTLDLCDCTRHTNWPRHVHCRDHNYWSAVGDGALGCVRHLSITVRDPLGAAPPLDPNNFAILAPRPPIPRRQPPLVVELSFRPVNLHTSTSNMGLGTETQPGTLSSMTVVSPSSFVRVLVENGGTKADLHCALLSSFSVVALGLERRMGFKRLCKWADVLGHQVWGVALEVCESGDGGQDGGGGNGVGGMCRVLGCQLHAGAPRRG